MSWRNVRRFACWTWLVAAVAVGDCPAQDKAPTDAEIRALLRTRIDTEKRGVGLAVGWVDEHGSRVVTYGRTALAAGHEVDGQTIFEIGSVTKVFTALLLAQSVERGEMKLDDPVAKYLPPGTRLPTRGGRQITLLDLATHHSGLPSIPGNMQPADAGNPSADYTLGQMFSFLSGYELTRDIGSQFEYSNLGFGLLGQVLDRRQGTDYEALVVDQVCRPLGMPDTRITLTPAQRARLAQPHDEALSPTENWDMPALAGTGALRSDAEDMLRFVSANVGLIDTPLKQALLATHHVYNTTDTPLNDIALAWNVNRKHGAPITWKSGGTGGYTSFVGFEAVSRRGVVVLSNAANAVDDIGLHLLNAEYPLQPPPVQRPAILIDPKLGDQYLGHYQAEPGFVFTFSRESDRYYVQGTGQIRFRALPVTATDFFLVRVNAQVSFVKNSTGNVTGLILHQDGDKTFARLP
jgi:D-alanyl-D-alanine-carboxypeptidase/D-alanyl-D-alanine-endopeptidase